MPLNPEGKSLLISRPLTTISTAFAQAGNWIANQVFPQVPVARQGDLYWHYPQGDWKRVVVAERAPATPSAGGGYSMSTDNYWAKVYAVHKDVDDPGAVNAAGQGFNLYTDASRWVTEQLMLFRDIQWTQTYMKTGIWTGGTGVNGGAHGADIVGGTSAGSNQVVRWDLNGGDPIKDLLTQRIGMARKTGFLPNTLVCGPMVLAGLLNSASIIERLKYSQPGILSVDLLRAVLEVDRLIVNWTTQNVAEKGLADNISFLPGEKDALLVYAAPAPGLQTLSGGYTFTWTGLLGAGAFGTRIKRFRLEEIEADRIEGELAYDMKLVAPQVGVYFSGIVS